MSGNGDRGMEGIRVGAMVTARRMEIKGQDQIGK